MEAIEREIVQIISEILEMDEEVIWGNRDLNFITDLGLDSLLALEIVASIEKKYKIEIDEERLTEVLSLNDSINLVKSLLTVKA